jgi:hypothetical protein
MGWEGARSGECNEEKKSGAARRAPAVFVRLGGDGCVRVRTHTTLCARMA